MKSKLPSICVFILAAYCIPLIGKPNLYLSLQLLLLLLIAVILFVTQPAITVSDTKNQKSNDKLSVLIILLASLLSQIISVVEWAYYRESFHIFKIDSFTSLGLVLLVGGTTFRIWCIRTLGKYFTSTVQTQTNQKVITLGAYSVIRHPSYLGAYLAIVGSAVLLHAYFGIIFSTLIMLAAYWYRIKVEEETLVREFGEEYKLYQARTKKLFPYIW
ncbi:MAG TPA: isoprenylcysteine carboxylmethyltransferase family protein [Bacteroidia bacterium]|nr:isoprenylcysteine carboxylmethyltransferase family protein [Bacteroidia bacterium]